MARQNPALAIFGNPPRSESDAWLHVEKYADAILRKLEKLSGANSIRLEADALHSLAHRMRQQLGEGIHTNPRARRTKIGSNVQAVVYIHATDHQPYVHGFGNAELNEDALQFGVLNMADLKAKTAVCLYGNANGTITLEGARGQRLWKNFQEDAD